MGMLSNLIGKVLGLASPAASTPPPAPAGGFPGSPGAVSPTPATPPAPDGGFPGSPGSVPTTPTTPAPDVPVPVATGPVASAPASVDVAAILDGLAAKSSESLDWKKSIVDMLKLVGMDSSLTARKELATELGYTGDEHDSATMNIWLHSAVMKKLAENGGKVPAELLH